MGMVRNMEGNIGFANMLNSAGRNTGISNRERIGKAEGGERHGLIIGEMPRLPDELVENSEFVIYLPDKDKPSDSGMPPAEAVKPNMDRYCSIINEAVDKIKNGDVHKIDIPSNIGTAEKQGLGFAAPRFDSYIHEEPVEDAGIYKAEYNENGLRTIKFQEADETETSQKVKSSKTTMDTEKVDREIEKLKQTKEQLERRIAVADEKNREVLEAELLNVETQLRQKDNDTYRRQHAQIR